MKPLGYIGKISLELFQKDTTRRIVINDSQAGPYEVPVFLEPGTWPDFAAPPQYEDPAPGWDDPRLPDFRKIWDVGRNLGYAIGLHGSMKRDVDLIAVAWVDEPFPSDVLVEHLCDALNAKVVGEAEKKPRGRIAYTLQIDGWYKPIDLSIVYGIGA